MIAYTAEVIHTLWGPVEAPARPALVGKPLCRCQRCGKWLYDYSTGYFQCRGGVWTGVCSRCLTDEED